MIPNIISKGCGIVTLASDISHLIAIMTIAITQTKIKNPTRKCIAENSEIKANANIGSPFVSLFYYSSNRHP